MENRDIQNKKKFISDKNSNAKCSQESKNHPFFRTKRLKKSTKRRL